MLVCQICVCFYHQVAVGDEIIEVDGCSVAGNSLAVLANKVLGEAASSVQCTFRRTSSGQDYIYTVNLIRGLQ